MGDNRCSRDLEERNRRGASDGKREKTLPAGVFRRPGNGTTHLLAELYYESEFQSAYSLPLRLIVYISQISVSFRNHHVLFGILFLPIAQGRSRGQQIEGYYMPECTECRFSSLVLD